MATQHILRIPRSDDPSEFVLIKASNSGKSELDLTLIATEGENPYAGSVKTSQIKKLRAKNYRGSDDEWAGVLSYVFNQNRDSEISKDWTSGLEVVATVTSTGDGDDDDDESPNELVITLRKRIDSITQRLGAVTLHQDNEQAIQLFDWTGVAVTRANDISEGITSLKSKFRAAEDTISQLNSQLDELIQAKKEHDDQLIAKFAQLLNEKKLKIRNQQRLLATANVDTAKVEELEATSSAGKHGRKPDTSRSSKRKAGEEPEPDSESDDAFDTMEVDKPDNAPVKDNEGDEQVATESDRQSTPEPMEDEETASENEDEAVPAAKPSAARPTRKKDSAPPQEKPADAPNRPQSSAPPPRRELPFARSGGAAKPAPPKESHEENENEATTETDDDEL